MKFVRIWGRRALLFALAMASGLIMTLTASYLYLAPLLPPAEELQEVDYQIPLRVYSRDGQLLGEFGEMRRTPLTYEEIPRPFINAVLAAEDERFFRHGGVDPRGLARAALELVRYRDIRSGGSTITMQVARNFFLDKEQKFLRKFNEIVLALEIENILTKEQILELYLNKIYLGHRAYGAEAAARVYYGKGLHELDLAQWAMIAGLPKAPSAYNPITNPERALIRRDWILGRMLALGMISEAEWQEAVAAPVTARYHGSTPDIEAAYVAEMVRRALLDRYDAEQVYSAGLRVFTTLDGKMQSDAVAALRNGLHEYDERHGWRGPEARIELPEDLVVSFPADDDLGATPDAAALAGERELLALDGQPLQPDGAAEADTEDDLLAPLAEALRRRPVIGRLQPALVLAVEERRALLLLGSGETVVLPWEQISWARPHIDVDRVGDPPQEVADVLAPGDVVRLRPVHGQSDGDDVWRLAQAPRAESALVALDPRTGAVRALVGGYSFARSHYNRVIQGGRQAGSAFKPFIYTAGLLDGLTPATLINDAPVVFEDEQLETAWRPTGASSRFYGPTRLREALYRSLNLVSIRVLRRVGIPSAMRTLEDFGLPVHRFPRDLSLALGSASVTPLELASGYSVLANGGFRVEPWFIERIEDSDGEVIWQAPEVVLCDEQCVAAREQEAALAMEDAEVELARAPDRSAPKPAEDSAGEAPVQPEPVIHTRALEPRAVWLMDSMLKDVVRRGTAWRASRLGRGDLAGKTGTTNELVDAWFAGYSPALVSTVWVGFDEPTTLGNGEYGGRAALPIWMEFMANALQGVPEIQLPQPPGIVTVRIDPQTGRRARPGDQDTIFEYFREENLPEAPRGPAVPQEGSGPAPEQLF